MKSSSSLLSSVSNINRPDRDIFVPGIPGIEVEVNREISIIEMKKAIDVIVEIKVR